MCDEEKKVESSKSKQEPETLKIVNFQRKPKPKFPDPDQIEIKQRAPKPLPDPVDPIIQTQESTAVAKSRQVAPKPSNQEQQNSTTQDSGQAKE